VTRKHGTSRFVRSAHACVGKAQQGLAATTAIAHPAADDCRRNAAIARLAGKEAVTPAQDIATRSFVLNLTRRATYTGCSLTLSERAARSEIRNRWVKQQLDLSLRLAGEHFSTSIEQKPVRECSFTLGP
jgi:hypothetical protein